MHDLWPKQDHHIIGYVIRAFRASLTSWLIWIQSVFETLDTVSSYRKVHSPICPCKLLFQELIALQVLQSKILDRIEFLLPWKTLNESTIDNAFRASLKLHKYSLL